MTTIVRFQLRQDTAANWTSENPTLAQGEPGYETDTGNFKIGDGTTAWTSLPSWSSSFPVMSVLKTSDETRQSDTTFSADSELETPVLEAGTFYRFEVLMRSAADGNADVAFKINGSGLGTGGFVQYSLDPSDPSEPANVQTTQVNLESLGIAYDQITIMTGLAYAAPDASSPKLFIEWRQRVFGPSSTIVKAGSHMILTKL